jgi:hypothetical protein
MPQQTDAQMLRDSMTREVSNDAYSIAGQIFKGQESDVARVSNDQIDERYRQAFSSNDRQYLMQEAARDPVQFLSSMQRLGVQMPPGQEVQPEPKLPAAAKPNVPVPKPPESTTQTTYQTPQAVPSTSTSATPLATPTGGGPTLPLQPTPLAAPAPALPPPPGVIPPNAQPL